VLAFYRGGKDDGMVVYWGVEVGLGEIFGEKGQIRAWEIMIW